MTSTILTSAHGGMAVIHTQQSRPQVHRLITTHCRARQPFSVKVQRYRDCKVRNSTVCAASSVEATGKDTSTCVKLLQQAAATRSVAPKEVFAAIRKLEKEKLSADGWAEKLGGESSPGRRWQLVFTTGTKQVQDALKGGKGGGSYFPLIAAQRWDTPKREIENGVYLGHIASISFLGPWALQSRKMTFDFKRINIKLGPWKFGFDLKAGQFGTKKAAEEGEKQKDGPFFLFIYVDDKICVARGRGGGLAMWGRTSPVWEAKAGLIQA